jgi:hypothetical protein
VLHEYTKHNIERCLQHSAMVFVGDSTVRRLFWAIVKKMNIPGAYESLAEKHSNLTFEQTDTMIQFIWDPYLNVSSMSNWLGVDPMSDLSSNITSTMAIVVSSGLWYAKHMEHQYLDLYKSQLRSLTDAFPDEPRTLTRNAMLPPGHRSGPNRIPIFLPVIRPGVSRSNENRSRTFGVGRLELMNTFLGEEAAAGRIELFQSFSSMAQSHPAPFESDGLHLSEHLTSMQANMLLNFLCNSKKALQGIPYDKTCCNIAPGSQLAVYKMFTFIIILVLLTVGVKLRWFSAAFQTCRTDGSLKNLMVLSLAVVYCCAADRSPLFEKINKPINLPAFILLVLSGSICGLASLNRLSADTLPSEKNAVVSLKQNSFLSRQQSEEWKGWMQLVILLYHYFGMSSVIWVYQVARLLVASYLFMTGFGHTTYFLRTKDFSIYRLAAVLLRLNMLSCILGYIMLSSYDFYYFSVLCSFWFVVVVCTLGVGFSGDITVGGITARCLGSILCVNFFIYIPGILEGLSIALHTLCRINFHAQEFRFRAGLDLYVVYVGVLVGWLYHKRHEATFYSWLDSHLRGTGWRRWTNDNESSLHVVLKVTCALIMSEYLILTILFADKYQYNLVHPWMSPVFVLAYLALRNSSKQLRETHSPLFAWLGRCSLETYILQCHIWLAGDAKGLLRLGLFNTNTAGDVFEAMLITVFFIWTSYHVSKASSALTAAVLGSKKATTSRGIAAKVLLLSSVLVAINWLHEVQLFEIAFNRT